MKADKISLDNAKSNNLFYFVANVIIFRESDNRCLILKRSETEKVHPSKYCVPGGKLDWSDLDISNPTRMNGDVHDFEDALEKLLQREAKEECGLEIEDKPFYINSVGYIRPDGVPVMMLKFVAKYKSGEVEIEDGAITDYAWVNEEEIKNYDCIDGIKEEVTYAISLFNE
jgi:8-oxo-dGTP pyrophosphatase MutT (NUDIX family)